MKLLVTVHEAQHRSLLRALMVRRQDQSEEERRRMLASGTLGKGSITFPLYAVRMASRSSACAQLTMTPQRFLLP